MARNVFKLDVTDQDRARLKGSLAAMLQQRNELVHHFLPKLTPETPAVFSSVCAFLDGQREEIRAVTTELEASTETLRQSMREFGKLLETDQFKRMLFEGQSERSLMDVLVDVAARTVRTDGWTYLAGVGSEFRAADAGLLLNLKEKHGNLTLKGLLRSEDLVDPSDEPTSNGNYRTLYKLRPR